MAKRVAIILCALAVTACATPINYTDKSMVTFDRDTEYATEDRPGGFTLTINYSRYQFIPESSALAAACKSALTSVAYDLAERKGREIQPVNEQRIKLSFGRNGFTGTTSCSASSPIDWKS